MSSFVTPSDSFVPFSLPSTNNELTKFRFQLLVALHVWTAMSTFEALGPFGWFYGPLSSFLRLAFLSLPDLSSPALIGDFFIAEYPHELVSTSVYRFLVNPERSMGGAAFFGLSLLSGSKLVLAQAIVAVTAHWWFLSSVER